MLTLYLLLARGISAQIPLGLFSTRANADTARLRAKASNDGWHEIEVHPIPVDEWNPGVDLADALYRGIEHDRPSWVESWATDCAEAADWSDPMWRAERTTRLPAPAADDRPWAVAS